jgi:histidinol dehydrogenase
MRWIILFGNGNAKERQAARKSGLRDPRQAVKFLHRTFAGDKSSELKRHLFPGREEWEGLLKRPQREEADLDAVVREVFDAVARDGDAAVLHFTEKFDHVRPAGLRVDKDVITGSAAEVSKELQDAIRLAASNIERFHASQRLARTVVETVPGVECWREERPIERVGIYIPGGTAPLFSTVLMLGIPARLAGCNEIVLCTPPDREGRIHPAILFCAHLLGIDQVMAAGGIQAIAAMALGTETVPQVSKIFGPGNQFVTAAKQHAQRLGVAIDMPAGPSELLVMADDTANPAFVAADLLSQAEHGTDSQVILVTTSEPLIDKVEKELAEQLDMLPRKAIAGDALGHSKAILLETDRDCLDLINLYGPEHFIICCANEGFFVSGIVNAGSVFIGNHTPESAGDYASGTNHTLPTNGFAKAYSGVNLQSFTRSVTFQRISEEGIRNIGPAIELMAEAEGLQAHRNAVTLRLG